VGSYIDTEYITTRVKDRYIVDLTDLNGGGVINETLLDETITTAESMINVKLANRYTVPVTTPAHVLNVLRHWTLQISKYLLYHYLMQQVPEDLAAVYNDIIDELNDIHAGKVQLEGATGKASPGIALVTDKTTTDVVFNDDMTSRY